MYRTLERNWKFKDSRAHGAWGIEAVKRESEVVNGKGAEINKPKTIVPHKEPD